jgi:catechol 2,3-dioxygenase
VTALHEVAQAAVQAGGQVVLPVGAVTEPGGGMAVTVADADGRIFQLVHGDAQHADAAPVKDRPLRLAHAVLNAHDVPATQHFLEAVLDFSLSDRTRIMAFMRCNSDHHSIALGDTDNDALNHIAFLMPDLESVMRGGGRLRDAGYGIEWGPGRHGPGDNAFNYFVGPFDVVVEYTAEVQQIDDSYLAHQPADWTWPPGRVDQWGISQPPSARLKEAQRAVVFVPITP